MKKIIFIGDINPLRQPEKNTTPEIDHQTDDDSDHRDTTHNGGGITITI